MTADRTGTQRLTVGITGHRPNRLAIGASQTARRLRFVLSALSSGIPPDVQRIAVSALAEGADRIFATKALAGDFKVHALLPFSVDDYITTFGDPSATTEFHELHVAAAEVRTLDGTLSDSAAAYEAVGVATVATSDLIIAVWDGAAAAGRGGTPEVVAHAVNLKMPVIWINAAEDQPPKLLLRSGETGSRTLPFATLARHAPPLSRARIAALARAACAQDRHHTRRTG